MLKVEISGTNISEIKAGLLAVLSEMDHTTPVIPTTVKAVTTAPQALVDAVTETTTEKKRGRPAAVKPAVDTLAETSTVEEDPLGLGTVEEEVTPTIALTHEDVAAKLKKINKAGGVIKVTEVLNKVGLKTFKDVEPKHYDAIVKHANEVIKSLGI